MLRSHLKIALRNLLRHKGYTFINVFGLAVGLACCVLIVVFVRFELSYDHFHDRADRIHRIGGTGQVPGSPPDEFAVVSRPVARNIRQEYPEVEAITRINPWNPTVRHEAKYFYDDEVLITEPDFLRMFSFPLIRGNPETALKDPYTMVLTETTARKYFGETDPMGRTLILYDTLTFTVTGVAADVPPNSHLEFDVLTSFATQEQQNPVNDEEWLAFNSFTYVLLKPSVDPAAFEAKISDLIMRNYGEQLKGAGITATLDMEPLTGIYLHSKKLAQIGETGSMTTVYVCSAIAAFVLLIACINFVNLATARSMERAKEVGVRKVVGSSRGALVRQFLSESTLIALIGLLLSGLLVLAAIPFFDALSGKELDYSALLHPVSLLVLIGLVVVVGLLAGSYPALALSSFKPVDVLKGAFRTSTRGALLRQGLVVFQFAISAALIVGTLVVIQQLRHMKIQDVGFAKDQVLVLEAGGVASDDMARSYRSVKQELAKHPGVQSVSATGTVPGRGHSVNIVFGEDLPEGESRRMDVIFTDHDYVETMGIEIIAGRDFSEAFETDAEQAVLINEMAVKDLGYQTPEEAVGKTMNFGGDQQFTIVGVIGTYHHKSLKHAMMPLVVRIFPPTFNLFAARINTADVPAALAHLESTWTRLFPGQTFEYFFLNDDFNKQYAAEERLTRIFGVFAFIAILVACLGLFGLASFITQQRTKEIGVRKVLGASVPGIVLLLSKDFVRLVLIALVVAAPLAYFGMEAWLKEFPYRIRIGPEVFLITAVLALLIAVLTVSYQAIRAATADPVKSLRYE